MEPGRIVGGRYRLQRRLASGGMGTVWEATHLTLDVPVAVKFIIDDLSSDPALLARFEREARAAARLQSPHVVRTYDYGLDDGTPYMAMELLQGEPLETRLERLGRLPSSEVTSMARQVAKGLHEAHALGIVHRDLKPANIFFARTGGDETIKILDFGIARDESSPAADDRTATGTLMGSPRHMSPEQARGSRVDWRSDLWSFGVVLFRCLTGERPFDGPNVGAVLASVFADPIPAASALSPDLAAEVDVFFERALARNPDLRFQSASDMAEALARALGPSSAVSDASSEVVAREPPVRPRTEDTRAFAPPRIPDSDVTNAASTVVLSGAGASDAAAPRERASTPRRFVSLAIVVAVGASVALLAWHQSGGGVPDDARSAEASSAHLPDSMVRTAAGATEPPQVGAPDVRAPPGASSSAAPAAPPAATPRAAAPRPVGTRPTPPRLPASQAPVPPPTSASPSDPFFD